MGFFFEAYSLYPSQSSLTNLLELTGNPSLKIEMVYMEAGKALY
jgi:hypothetical protein